MSVNGVSRQLRLEVSLFKTNIGVESFNYGSAGEATDIAAHPDDTGAESQPVNAEGQKSFEFNVGSDLKVDFWQWVYLKYQLQWDGTSERKDIDLGEYGCLPEYDLYEPTVICNGKPVPNETPYAKGDGSTFAYANEGSPSLMHSLSVGFYPILYQEEDAQGFAEHTLGLEAGIATKNYALTRGWVRDGVVEIKDEKDINLWGVTWGIEYQSQTSRGGNPSFLSGIRFGLKGAHFIGNSNVFTVEFSVPLGLGL